jgi:hypothetical protein
MGWFAIILGTIALIGLVLQLAAWRRRRYQIGGPISRFGLPVLSLLAASLTGGGLILAASLKTDVLANKVLSLNPQYALAIQGHELLKKMEYPVQTGENQTANLGVLTIDDPSWPIFLDFIKSDIAIRKSERNEPPGMEAPRLQQTPPSGNGAEPANPSRPATPLPEINFDRIKTIVSIRVPTATAGTKPLAPPYRLMVLWPDEPMPAVPRRVYEFLSFEEFRLDLRRMLLDRMEEWSLWIAVVAFAIGLPIDALRRFTADR